MSQLTGCTEEKLDLSSNAIKVLEKRYLKRDAEGVPTEEPKDLFFQLLQLLHQIFHQLLPM